MENKGFANVNDMLKNKDKKILPIHGEEATLGRPKKAPAEKKSERVVCYLTQTELWDLQDLAEKDDITNSNYVRKIILEHIKNSK